jgi:hypothetical protein
MMGTTMKTLTPAEFIETYRPLPNRFDKYAGYDGYLHNCHGPDYQEVLKAVKETPDNVWTYLDAEDEPAVLCSGFSMVNRLGYVITEVPIADDEFIEVVDED